VFLWKIQQDAPTSQLILFLKNALHISDGLSVHHQEIKTADCLLASSQQFCLTYACCCTYSLDLL